MKIRPFTRGPRAAVTKLNKLLGPWNNGVVINENPSFNVERQSDGRIRIRLSPSGRKKLGLP